MTVAERIEAAGPKKILALDGGGIRGMMTVEILASIEGLLRNAQPPENGDRQSSPGGKRQPVHPTREEGAN